LRIAVADADAAAGQRYRDVLSRLGHESFVGASAAALAELCRVAAPDLVIVDAGLPECGGIAAAWAVCREQTIPFILLLDDDLPMSAYDALDGPFFGCLHKPVAEPVLRAAVTLALRMFEQAQARQSEIVALRKQLEDRKVIERAKGVVGRRVGVVEDEAYRRLRKYASDRNLKLVDAARIILAADAEFAALEACEGRLELTNGWTHGSLRR
jgi:response regulator NasT